MILQDKGLRLCAERFVYIVLALINLLHKQKHTDFAIKSHDA